MVTLDRRARRDGGMAHLFAAFRDILCGRRGGLGGWIGQGYPKSRGRVAYGIGLAW